MLALVDFYFGDSNYSKDQFLRKQATLDVTGSGWISVEVVASFKKMKKLTEDRALILECIRRSTVVELNKDETFLKRREALLKDLEDTYAKTVLIGNLNPTATADSIRSFCSAHGTVVRVRFPFANRDELPESVRQVCMEDNGNYLKCGVKIEQKSLYAMVEYATIKQASAAVKSLLSDRDWRTDIFATLLFKRLKCDSPAVSEPASQNPSRTASPFLQSSSSMIVERARANSFSARLLRERTQQNDAGNTLPSPSPSQSQETTPTSWRDRSNSCNTRPKTELRTLDASSPPSAPGGDNSIFRNRANSLNSRPTPGSAGSASESARSWRAGGPAASRSPSASPHVARRHLSPDTANAPVRAPTSTPRSTTLSHTESPSSTWTAPSLVIRQPAGPDGTRGFARRAAEPQPQQSCAA